MPTPASQPPEPPAPGFLPFFTRLWFAWVCWIRVLFDGSFAARVWRARDGALPSGASDAARLAEGAEPGDEDEDAEPSGAPAGDAGESAEGSPRALQLLALLQREGRLVDFLEQDVTTFSDAEVGAAARIVHEGCRKTLRRVAAVEPVRRESEGAKVVLEAGFAPSEVVLVGNVHGAPPYRGILRHRGWRAAELRLPEVVPGHDPRVLAPAEVEL